MAGAPVPVTAARATAATVPRSNAQLASAEATDEATADAELLARTGLPSPGKIFEPVTRPMNAWIDLPARNQLSQVHPVDASALVTSPERPPATQVSRSATRGLQMSLM